MTGIDYASGGTDSTGAAPAGWVALAGHDRLKVVVGRCTHCPVPGTHTS